MFDPQKPTLSMPPNPSVDPAATRPHDGCSTPGENDSSRSSEPPAELNDHPRYRVIRPLGQGGMGAVFLAEHKIMDRRVALKVIHPRYTASTTAIERFRREVRAAAQLTHPNIVAAYDAEQVGSTNFLVMEFVEGQTLAQLIHETGPLPVREACSYVLQVAKALQYAHEKGMVHRDIKPDNLMRTPSGDIRVLDFGLARLGEATDSVTDKPQVIGVSLTAVGAVMGTPDYMAPEQAWDSSSADIRADIYSLGATLFHLLTGTVPYPGGDIPDKLRRHAEQQVPPISAVRAGVPRGLEHLVTKMMAKWPEERPQTPARVIRSLRYYARPSRYWWWLASVSTASLLAIVAVVLLWYYTLWPGRGYVEFQGDSVRRSFTIREERTDGVTARTYTFVMGDQQFIRLPPGVYTIAWSDNGTLKTNIDPQRITIIRGETTVVKIQSDVSNMQEIPVPPTPKDALVK